MHKSLRYMVALFLALQSWQGHAAGPGVAEIVSIQGKAEYREASEPRWRDAVMRQKLAEGNFVRTDEASRMALLLADQTQIQLAANSMLQIKQVGDQRDRGTILRQSSGRSWSQSKNVPNQLTVETPSAMAAIRGTDWEMVVEPDGSATLTVLSGQVLLSNEQGSVSVAAGEQARARIGMAPVKQILANPKQRVQWVTSFAINPGRYPELDGAARQGGPDGTALNEIGQMLRAGDLAGARRRLEMLLASHPLSGTARLLAADFQVIEGEIDAAVAALRAGASQTPDDERFDIWRARLHMILDQNQEAHAALAAARLRNPQSVEALIAEGELERLEGHALAASAAYRSALALAPQSARAWHGLGVVQTEREEVAPARESLHRALALEPNETGLLAELGTLEAFAGDLKAARTAFAQSIEKRADDYVALAGLGLVELKAGNAGTAITHLLAATVIEPRYARAQTWLAVAYYQLGRSRDALFALGRVRELDPKDPLPDLLESIIRNDRLQPGEALITARRALSLLPYLKSLNQVANDQKGGANLGSALAAFGLEDWARSYAQDTYYPFWAGSHLFLANRYSGSFNKKSEQFQGFLADPTVFGASNRFSSLISRPGNYFTLGARHNVSDDLRVTEPTMTVNGQLNVGVPLAYFAEAIRTATQSGRVTFDSDIHTYTLAAGVRPGYALGLFAYANVFDADLMFKPSGNATERLTGRNERLDLGAHYRFGPESQLWLKIGQGSETASKRTVATAASNSSLSNVVDFETRPDQRDLQLRHTFSPGDRHTLSWGAEFGQMEKSMALVRENYFHLDSVTARADRLMQYHDDRSSDVWLSDQFQLSSQIRLQADLAWQHYTKTREINIFRDRVPPATQSFPESYGREIAAPRLGASYVLKPGATLRAAYQRWLRPASYNTLAPVATAGIPIDDALVNPGGLISRWRVQFDWELSEASFVTAFADRKSIDNLRSPLDGVLNTRGDLVNLDRLRQDSMTRLGAPDQLEATPVFASGTAQSGGVTLNQVLSRNFSTYVGYARTHSENTGAGFKGKAIPYLPQHLATAGLTWASDRRVIAGVQAVWRSARFSDEANLTPLPAGWELALRLHWESEDKRWTIQGYAENLLKREVAEILGVNLVVRF